MMLLKINSMLNNTIMSQKGKAVAMLVVLAFAVAVLTAVTSLSYSPVVAQGLGNNTTDCFKIIGEAKVSTGNVQNYTKSVQNFFSLLSADNKLTSINEN